MRWPSAQLLDGKQLAQTMQAEIAAEVAAFAQARAFAPGLAAVLVGDNPASQIYVRNKRRACEKVGMESWLHALPAETTQDELLDLVARSTPTPRSTASWCSCRCRRRSRSRPSFGPSSPLKDVDGFGPENLGLLAAGQPRFLACTPLGVQQLLVRNGIDIEGRHVVIVGRSNIVGKPLALILMQKAPGANATVTVCHSRSRNLAELTRQADIVVVAIGQARFLKADMVRPGAVVVDVGMNRLPDGKLVGDVDFAAVQAVAVGDHAGAGRRRADDHHHAAAQHPAWRRSEPGGRRFVEPPLRPRGGVFRDTSSVQHGHAASASTCCWCSAWSSPCAWGRRSSFPPSSRCCWPRSWRPRRTGCTIACAFAGASPA